MSDTDPDLDRLNDLLHAIPAERDGMSIGELDGYAGIGPGEPPAFGRKVGRNEPCPCGSGRKYKRCRGAH